MKNKVLVILLVLALIKGIIWMFLTPIFQIPDESSHFSIVQFIAETGRRPHPRREKPTSKELIEISRIFGFNWEIVHPVWQGYFDNWKKQVNQIPDEWRNSFITNQYQTSLKRPPLYYWLATPFYLLFKQQPFFFRFFSVRFLSVLISLVIGYFSFLIAKLIFKRRELALAVASLVIFQPMFSFMSSGAHYDSLTVLLATIFLYLSAKYIKSANKKYLILSFVISLLGLFVKPDLIVLLLIYPFLLPKKKLRVIIPLGLVIIILLTVLLKFLNTIIIRNTNNSNAFSDKLIYLINLNEYSSNISNLVRNLFSGQIFRQFVGYFRTTWQMHLAQVFPWYWGVFGWLEIVMPAIVYKIIKIVISISLIGWLRFLYQEIKKPSLSRSAINVIRILFLSAIFHLGLVIFNDFIEFTVSGINFGIQGRYLLPFISVHMILLVMGLSQLIAKKHYQKLAGLLIIGSIALNLIGLSSLYQYFGWVW